MALEYFLFLKSVLALCIKLSSCFSVSEEVLLVLVFSSFDVAADGLLVVAVGPVGLYIVDKIFFVETFVIHAPG